MQEYLWNVGGGCFFRLRPIFCDGKSYSPPWQISIGSICEEQECGGRAPVVAQHRAARGLHLFQRFKLYSSTPVSPWHFAFEETRLRRTVFCEKSFSRKFLQMLSRSCLFPLEHLWKISRIFDAGGEHTQDLEWKLSAVIRLLCRRKWDQTEKVCLMKTV